MKKTQTKFFYYSIFILTLFLLSLNLISYLISISNNLFTVKILLWLILSALFATFITYGYALTSSTIADAMFTLRRMHRAENLSNPLLLRLATEAPGTYHHSINVSNLAQHAARAIKADSLLVRVASYYHDIGKLNEPKLFVENQAKTDFLEEEASALWIRSNAKKIISHVVNGKKIATESQLPQDVIEIISEHHGNSKALYFYGKAKDRGLKIKKSDFAYPCPKPSSKESAIIMLADCIEASAKAKRPSDEKDISQIVDSIIEEKVVEKQLVNSGLSSGDLKKVSVAFKESLSSIYHKRVDYEQ